jgi:hypothetical protein
MVGAINKIVTHADPTAYNRQGVLTKIDRNGLSAYLRFLRHDVLESRRFRTELEEDFTPEERAKLHKALEDGEKVLADAWKRRRTMFEVTQKAKVKTIEVCATRAHTRAPKCTLARRRATAHRHGPPPRHGPPRHEAHRAAGACVAARPPPHRSLTLPRPRSNGADCPERHHEEAGVGRALPPDLP